MFLPVTVCPFVCLSESYERILIKFWSGMGRGLRIIRLDFGGDPHPGFLHPGPAVFKGLFIYYCDSCRQPRIKRKHPRRRFDLC